MKRLIIATAVLAASVGTARAQGFDGGAVELGFARYESDGYSNSVLSLSGDVVFVFGGGVSSAIPLGVQLGFGSIRVSYDDDGFGDGTDTINTFRLIGFVDPMTDLRVGVSVSRYDTGYVDDDNNLSYGLYALYSGDPIRIEASWERPEDGEVSIGFAEAEYDLGSALTLRANAGRTFSDDDFGDLYRIGVGAEYDVTPAIYVFGDAAKIGNTEDGDFSTTLVSLGAGYRFGPDSEVFIAASRATSNDDDNDATGVTLGARLGFGANSDRAFGPGAAFSLELF